MIKNCTPQITNSFATVKRSFKMLLTVFVFVATFINTNAQTWVNVGTPGFSAGGVEYTSLAIDGSGTPYVVYEDYADSQKATVMKYNGSSWVNVGSAGLSTAEAEYTSIAIDGSGTPYVVYSDIPYGSVYGPATVKKYNGSSWVNVGTAGFSAGDAEYTSIAINGSGTPYVVFGVGGSGATVMKYNGSSWVTVGSAGFTSGGADYTSIAIDGSGTPYVVYTDYASKATVMKYNGTSWVTVGSAEFSAGYVGYTSIAIDGSGTPYVAYADGSDSDKATVMKYNGSSWVTVGSAGFSGGEAEFTYIAIEGSGTPYVVYTDYSTPFIGATVKKYNGSSWVTVGSAGFSSGWVDYTSIAIDGSGTPYVVYEDHANGNKATVMNLGTTTVSPITGIDTLCIGATTTLNDITSSGTWSSSNTSIASVGVTGIVTGITTGTAIISYTVSGNSGTVTVTVNSCLSGIKNISNSTITSLIVFPNPNQGLFTVNLSASDIEDAKIIVTNILGEKIKALTITTNKETEVQLHAPSGIYFISAIIKNEIVNAKIMIE